MAEFLSVLFIGLTVGSIYALSATGLVLTYRISGIYNFAQGAIGMFFAYTFFQLNQGGRMNLIFGTYDQHWHLPAAIAMVLLVGGAAFALGWGLDVILFRRIRDAGTVVKIVATIGVLIALQGLAAVIWPSASTRLTPHPIFPTHVFTVGGFTAPTPYVVTILLVIGLALGLLAFLRFSPLGVRMRAVVDRPEVAELMGVDSGRVSGMAWGIGTAFAALAGILLAPFYGSLDTLTLTFLVIAATAAAVVGRLESIGYTLLGGFGIGMAQQLIQRYVTDTTLSAQLQQSVPFIVLFGLLLLPIRWPETPDRPPRAPRAHGGPVSFRARSIRVGLIGLALVVPALAATPDWQSRIATVPPMAVIFLSLVLLAGFAGQISLAQGAFAGFGAFITADLVSNGWPFFLAAVVAALLTVPLGALLASRAARLPPLFLGFATLAFGALMDQVAFNNASFTGGLGGKFFQRPGFVSSSLSFYFAGLIVFAVFALVVTNIRKGKIGLALGAMRDSQTAVASLGGNVTRLKFVAFCTSAFIAGFGGAMLAGATGIAFPISYLEIQSLLFLALAVIGGIGTWNGALIGAVLFQLFAPALSLPAVSHSWIDKHIFHGLLGDPSFLAIFFGLGAIGLAQNPHGVVEQVREGFHRFVEGVNAVRTFGRKRVGPEPEEGAPAPAVASGNGAAVAFPQGKLYHRPDCVLTVGKDGASPVSGDGGSRRPCPVCEPEAVGS